MEKKTYYTNYSIPQLRFIRAHHIFPVSKGTNKHTGRQFWVFELNEDLSKILKRWSENKPSQGAN